jgi:uncharacterized surface protein with fasciclin (FAS1) repeats
MLRADRRRGTGPGAPTPAAPRAKTSRPTCLTLGLAAALAALAGLAAPAPATAQEGSGAKADLSVEVGGAAMSALATIIENAAASKDHTRFVAALKAAGLAETLEGPGPFTVFAPVNRAFEKLPDGAAGPFADPANLQPVLAYHVLAGRHSAADFIAAIGKGGGAAAFPTLQGEPLTVRQDGRRIEIIDARGRKATVTISDVPQKNGVLHVIDAVLLPKS